MESAESQRGHKASDFTLRDQAHISIGDHYYNSTSEITHPNRVILNWFSPLNFSARQKDIFSKIQQGTGKRFLQNEQFQRWCKGTVKTLWCHGIPGAGKTFLSSIAIDHLRSTFDGDAIGIGCIFCDYNEQQDQTAEYLISSLCKQFVESQKDFPRNIPAEMSEMHQNHQKDQTQPSFGDRLGMLHKVVSRFSKVFIVVDALDECIENHDTRGKVIRGIRSLLSDDAQVMLTSRKVPQIERLCEGWPQVEINADDQDIRMYLDAHMEDEGDLVEVIREDEDLRKQIITTILQMSQGMFLLARLQLAVLFYQDNRAGVLRALDSLPQTLFDSYDVAWERVQKSPKSERAKQVLSWISFALRPLTVREVQDALAVSPNDKYLNTDARPAQGTLASSCMGLVVIDQASQVIRLVHETTQAYFKDRRQTYFPHAQQMIAETCLTYLLFDTFDKGYYPFDEQHQTRLHLLDYAARYWGYHASGDVEQAIEQLIFEFLENDTKVSYSALITLPLKNLYTRYPPVILEEFTAMHISAYFGLRHSMAILLDSKVEPDSKDSCGRTPLSWAAEKGQEAVVELLLKTYGVHPDSKDSDGQTPLSWAAKFGHEAVSRILLENGATIDMCTKQSRPGGRLGTNWNAWMEQTALHLAVEKGHEAVVILLLSWGADINKVSQYRRLEYSNGRQSASSVSHETTEARTVLHLAVEGGHEAVVNLLLKWGADINKPFQRTFRIWDSLKSHDQLCETAIDVSTSLHLAALRGHKAVVLVLLQYGHDLDINRRDQYGQTALHHAARLGHVSTAQLLLKEGIEPDSRDLEGRTPLSQAADKGHKAIVELLLATEGIEPDSRDLKGRTPLSRAADKGHKVIVELLLTTNGVDPDVKDCNGQTPLSRAADKGHKVIVELLLTTNGVDPDAKDCNGQTPLSWAAAEGHETVVALLLATDNINPDARDFNGRTPLSWAAGGVHAAVVKLLIADNRVNSNSEDKDGRTPLSWVKLRRNYYFRSNQESRYKLVRRLLASKHKGLKK